MFEEIKKWFKSDKYGISLSLMCAIIPLIPSIIRLILYLFGNKEIISGCYSYEFWFAFSQILVSLIGLIIIVFIYKPKTLNEISDSRSLKDYIEEICQIKQNINNNSEMAYKIVKSTVSQFYGAWLMIWLTWALYYGVEFVFYSSPVFYNNTYLTLSFSNLKYFLDFCNSVSIYAAYIVLNDATVNIKSRTNQHNYLRLLIAVALCIFIFFLCIILQIVYLSIPGYDYLNMYTKTILCCFGGMSLIMVLGKLNSNRLDIPRILMSFLYIYAVSQFFSVFIINNKTEHNCEFTIISDAAQNILPWITSFGKVVLLISLSWILDHKRLILYIIHSSISITSRKTDIQEFNRYME